MRFIFYLPVLLALFLFLGLGVGIFTSGGENVREEGVSLPVLMLPDLYGAEPAYLQEITAGKGYVLVNIFGSWCVMCRIEHPFLMEIKKQGTIPIIGLNWKDEDGRVREWLERLGNPYEKVLVDKEGKAVIALGITGAPETLLISPTGQVIARQRGPLSEEVLEELLSLMKR